MFSSRVKQATLHKVKPIFIDNEESTTKVEIITAERGQQQLTSENKWHTGFKLVGDTLTQVFFCFFFHRNVFVDALFHLYACASEYTDVTSLKKRLSDKPTF